MILAALAAQVTGRPVKAAVTRQQMFAFTGYRTPTIQRVRLGADRSGQLLAIGHDVLEQTSMLAEFAEQTAVVTRMMYAAPSRRTTHRLVALNVPTPLSGCARPANAPECYALESAIDEIALACGVDPIELPVSATSPDRDPETGLPFSSRNLIACLREGARRFGWADRDPTPGVRRDGSWLLGSGVAASTYPARRRPSQASARRQSDGSYLIRVAAADIGTGARTTLTQIAAEALAVDPGRVSVELGDGRLAPGPSRRGLDGHRVLGFGGRQGVPAPPRAPRGGGDPGRHE